MIRIVGIVTQTRAIVPHPAQGRVIDAGDSPFAATTLVLSQQGRCGLVVVTGASGRRATTMTTATTIPIPQHAL